MLNKLRNSHTIKVIAVFAAVNFLTQIFFPTAAFALGGGPGQTEFQSFEPVGASEMVNLSSGDFTYNIPLLDVDGYPINLSYHSGISTDQEGSWVGLGWNVNPGVISRGMRGLPDDFAGDEVKKEINIRDNWTAGIKGNTGVELFGTGFTPSMGMGVFYNNYKGVGFEFSTGIGYEAPLSIPLTVNLGVTANSQEGMDIGADIGLSVTLASGENNSTALSLNVGASYSSRSGLKSINVSSGFSYGNSNPALKNGRINHSIGGGSIPIGTQSHVPKINVPTDGFGISFSASAGGEIYGLDLFAGFTGWYTEQSIATNSIITPAYGYLYAHEGAANPFSLKDFNREKDGVFHTTMPNLPLTNHTYDVYAVSGQGIGGMYRPYRNNVGTVSDPFMIESSSDHSFSGEIGAGNLFHLGGNYNYTTSYNISGEWRLGNSSNSDLQFKSNANGTELNESTYFKRAGELTVRDDTYYANIGGDRALQLDLNQTGTDIEGSSTLSGVSSANQYRTKRVQRNQNLSYLTAAEAAIFGLSKKIEIREGTEVPRVGGARKSKHLSEVTILREDGARYIYGIPAYNIIQKDVTFNVVEDPNVFHPDCATGLIEYVAGTDNTIGNDNGMDNYFEATTTPAYAHSYLLTAIISDDYVDITGDGPTEDDLGNYTKFNYAKDTSNYNWRVPLEANKAIYNGGFRSDTEDDKGSYIYGVKEVWYLRSVETKNYIAEFNLSDRKDAIGVVDENVKY
ncbi:MAG: hypothetical protein COB15_08725 [Flavobacteriales bacterium]|nr:MAG: hypothetical protein COB15_08725 [Flavobacteriales bacterium]